VALICIFTSSDVPGFDGLLRSPLAMTSLGLTSPGNPQRLGADRSFGQLMWLSFVFLQVPVCRVLMD